MLTYEVVPPLPLCDAGMRLSLCMLTYADVCYTWHAPESHCARGVGGCTS
jgi:hypothetical protein